MNEIIANLSVKQLAGMIDHTFLKPFGTAENIEKLCAEARKYEFAMVAINPAEVETCVKLLEGSPVRVGAAIGFPLGQTTTECKAFETRDAIAKGATEIDTVINVRALQKGRLDIVKKEIEEMVAICRPAGVICKVIVEDVALMRRVVGPEIGVKAAGGIRDLDTALAMIKAGATRIGTSSGVTIVEAYKSAVK